MEVPQDRVRDFLKREGGEAFRCRDGSCASDDASRCSCDGHVSFFGVFGGVGLCFSHVKDSRLFALRSISRSKDEKEGEAFLRGTEGRVYRTEWCYRCEGESIGEWGGSASAPWRASASCGKTCGSVSRGILSALCSWLIVFLVCLSITLPDFVDDVCPSLLHRESRPRVTHLVERRGCNMSVNSVEGQHHHRVEESRLNESATKGT